jgi:hypothetical protein
MNTYSLVLFVKPGLFIAIVAAATRRNINNTFLLFLEVEEPISLCLKVTSLPIMRGKDNRKVINSFFGHPTTGWVIQWFQWMAQFPPNVSPNLDQTGNLTMKYQPNSLVYMLPKWLPLYMFSSCETS